MMNKPDTSVFMDKTFVPIAQDVRNVLGNTYALWESLRKSVLDVYPAALEEWNHPGKNYGWSFRMKDQKRAIIYFLPREGFFKVALVFGQKATDEVLGSSVSEAIKKELREAKVYAEGRGIRIDVRSGMDLADIRQLIAIKLKH